MVTWGLGSSLVGSKKARNGRETVAIWELLNVVFKTAL